MTTTQPMTLAEMARDMRKHSRANKSEYNFRVMSVILSQYAAAIESHIAAQAAVEKDAERWRNVVNHAYVGLNQHTKTTYWFLRNIHARTGQTFQQAIDIAIAKTGGEG